VLVVESLFYGEPPPAKLEPRGMPAAPRLPPRHWWAMLCCFLDGALPLPVTVVWGLSGAGVASQRFVATRPGFLACSSSSKPVAAESFSGMVKPCPLDLTLSLCPLTPTPFLQQAALKALETALAELGPVSAGSPGSVVPAPTGSGGASLAPETPLATLDSTQVLQQRLRDAALTCHRQLGINYILTEENQGACQWMRRSGRRLVKALCLLALRESWVLMPVALTAALLRIVGEASSLGMPLTFTGHTRLRVSSLHTWYPLSDLHAPRVAPGPAGIQGSRSHPSTIAHCFVFVVHLQLVSTRCSLWWTL
jgi:hypothetical protein